MLSQLSYIPEHGSHTTVLAFSSALSARLPPHADNRPREVLQTLNGLKSGKDMSCTWVIAHSFGI